MSINPNVTPLLAAPAIARRGLRQAVPKASATFTAWFSGMVLCSVLNTALAQATTNHSDAAVDSSLARENSESRLVRPEALAMLTRNSSGAGSVLLSFDQVVQRSLAADPLSPVQQAALAASEGQLWQASRRPNPSLNLSAEDLTGSGPYSGLAQSEVTLSYQQRFERGGKRAARRQLAQAEQEILAVNIQLARLDLIAQIEAEYRQVQTAQALLLAHAEQGQRAEALRDIIAQRQQRGRDSDLALEQAELRLARALSQQNQAQLALNSAWWLLQSRWQPAIQPTVPATTTPSSEPQLYVEQASFVIAQDVTAVPWPSAEEAHPQRLLSQLQQQRAQAQLGLERAQAKLDPTLSTGLRYLQQSQDVSLVVALSLPIGLWEKNQGNIHSAAAQLEQSRWQAEAQEWHWQRAWQEQRAQAEQAAQLALDIETRLLKRARAAEARVLQRRAQGAASDVDVYSAQSLAAELGLQLIEAQESYHLAQAQARRLAAYYFRQRSEWFHSPRVTPFDSASIREGF